MTTWKKKLTKKELKHLKEVGAITCKWQLGKQAEHIKSEMKKPHDERSICWECRSILTKLGLLEA